MRSKKVKGLIVVAASLLALAAGLPPAGAGGDHDDVVLWNHLNGPWSVRHSAIGAGFTVLGTPVFRDGVYGRSMGTVDDETVLLMSSDDFFGDDRSQGTVRVFLKKRMVASVPYETPFNGVFGVQPYDFQDEWCSTAPKNPGGDTCTNYAIAALWGDGLSGPAGLYFQITDSTGATHVAVDSAFNTRRVPVGTWVPVRFVWDIDGIKGGADTLRIYRCGRVVARYSEPIPDVIDLPTPVAFAGSHATYRHVGPSLLYDELIVNGRAVTW